MTIIMKKETKKRFVIADIALLLGGASSAYAANDFNFSFVSNVIGKKEFKLKNKYATCSSRAETYRYNTNRYVSSIGNYIIDLDGNGFFNPDYDGTYHKADGYVYTTDYGKIKNNTYTVNIGTNSDLTATGRQIKGCGEIIQ